MAVRTLRVREDWVRFPMPRLQNFMSTNFINFFLIGLYFFGVIIIGWRTGRKETPQDFIIASRNVGFWRTTASIFAVLGGEMFIAQAALGYSMSFAAFWFWVGLASGTILLALAAPKIKALGDKCGFINLSEYFGLKWGQKNRIFAAAIIFLTFFALLVLQFTATGSIISPLLNISYPTVVIVSGAVVLAYLLLGGYKAVVATDLLQAILMFFIFASLVIFLNFNEINFVNPVYSIAIDPALFIAFFLIGIFVIFASADIWQRIYSAKTASVARKSLYTSTILWLIFGFFITLVGVAAKIRFPNIDPNEAFYWGLFGILPSWLVGLGVVMVLATIMSTIDTEVYLLSSTIAKDFVASRKRDIDDIQLIKIIKTGMAALSILAMLFAIIVRDVLVVLFGLASFVLSLSPVIVASLFWKLKPNAVFFSMIGGVLAFSALIILGQFTPENSVATLPAALVFLVIGQLIFRDSEIS